MLVPLGEFGRDLRPEAGRLGFRKGHDPVDDPADPFGSPGLKGRRRTRDLVGIKNCGCALEVNGH